MAKRQRFVRCVARAAQSGGDQCARAAERGSNPPLCAVHSGRPSAGVVAAQATDDPFEIVRRLMKDRDARIRLQAVALFSKMLERHEKGCPQCAERAAADTTNAEVVRRLTSDQEARLRDLINEIRFIKAQALVQPVKTSTLAYEASLEKNYADIDDSASPAVVPDTQVSEPTAVNAPNRTTEADDEVEIIFEDADAPEEDE